MTKAGNQLGYDFIERILRNPFYYGVFKIKNELYEASHEAMITKNIFDKVQARLKAKSRRNKVADIKDRNFRFCEVGKCGECGYSIINDYHQKGNGREFRYYRCSKKSKACNCTQKAINEKNLSPQIESLTSEIAINDGWYEYCQAQIQDSRDQEFDLSQKELANTHKALEANKKRLEKLLDLQLDGEISSEEYKAKKNQIITDNSNLERQINKINLEGSSWFELLSSALKTSNQAHHSIIKKDFTGMQKILKKTGSNHVLYDQKLSLNFSKPFSFFREAIMLTERCSSPNHTYLKNNPRTQLKSGVDVASIDGQEMQQRHTACHEPVRASGASAPQAREPVPCVAECVCCAKWQGV